MTLQLAWAPYLLAALGGGWLAGTLLYRRLHWQERSSTGIKAKLVAVGVLVLVVAFFNGFPGPDLAANAVALLLFVTVGRLSQLEERGVKATAQQG